MEKDAATTRAPTHRHSLSMSRVTFFEESLARPWYVCATIATYARGRKYIRCIHYSYGMCAPSTLASAHEHAHIYPWREIIRGERDLIFLDISSYNVRNSRPARA